jgi:amino acid transporter
MDEQEQSPLLHATSLDGELTQRAAAAAAAQPPPPPATTQPPQPPAAKLPPAQHATPSLGVLQLAAITFFAVSGGPYGFEDTVGSAGGYYAMLGLVILPLFWSFPLAFLTAELACAMPESGGHIVWVHRAFGPFWGHVNGVLALFTNAFDNALYPVMFCDYLEGMVYPDGRQFHLARGEMGAPFSRDCATPIPTPPDLVVDAGSWG